MKLLTIFVICLSLSACSLSGQKVPVKRYYRFVEITQLPVVSQSVIVKRPSAMGIIGNRPMVALSNDGSLIQMQHNFWLESPKVLLGNTLEKIFSQQSTSQADPVLYTEISRLEKQQQKAIVAIKFTLLSDAGQQVFEKTYRHEEGLVNNSIPAFVQVVSAMIEDIIKQLASDLP